MPSLVRDNQDFRTLLALYTSTQAEITRYRDLEWTYVRTFTAAIGAIIVFIVAYGSVAEATDIRLVLDAALISLALGNIAYTYYVHDRLTQYRNVRENVEYLLNLRKRVAKDDNIVDGNELRVLFNQPELTADFRRNWRRGFLSHLGPFFAAGIFLAEFGVWLLHRDFFPVAVSSLIIVVAMILLVLYHRHALKKNSTGQERRYRPTLTKPKLRATRAHNKL